MTGQHLAEATIEALAHGRDELAGRGSLEHLDTCATCSEELARARARSHAIGPALREHMPEVFLDDLVSAALAAQPAPMPSSFVPSQASLGLSLCAGLSLAAAAALLAHPALPTLSSLLGGLARSRVLFGVIHRVVSSEVPYGWSLVMVGSWCLLGACVLSARALFVRDATHHFGAALGVLLVGALSLQSSPALALELEGEFPDAERVTVTASREPLSAVLKRIASAARLGLVVTLPDDPLVSVHVRQMPLRDVLTSMLADQPVRVRRDGKMLTVRGLSSGTPVGDGAPLAAPGVPLAADLAPEAGSPALPTLRTLPNLPPLAPRGRPHERVVVGESMIIERGERVSDAFVLGGKLTVRGVVEGDAVVVGGDLEVEPGGEVHGDTFALGGQVKVAAGEPAAAAPGAAPAIAAPPASTDSDADANDKSAGEEDQATDNEADSDDDDGISGLFSSVSRYAMLFVLGLALLSVWPRRLLALQRAISESPWRTGALGAISVPAILALCLLLVVTILGIPLAIVVALGAALAMYAGLAASAWTLGRVLPISQLAEHPIRQLAAGVALLCLVSFVPVLGSLCVLAAGALGLGAMVRTRFSEPAAPPAADLPTPATDGPG